MNAPLPQKKVEGSNQRNSKTARKFARNFILKILIGSSIPSVKKYNNNLLRLYLQTKKIILISHQSFTSNQNYSSHNMHFV